MMKMAMRPQKKQVGGTYFEWLGQQGMVYASFKRTPYLQVGYRNFDVMLVGAAGGRSGKAGNDDRGYAHPAGGGGGESKRVQGALSTLPSSCTVHAGPKGGNGGNAGVSYIASSPHGNVEIYRWAGDGELGEYAQFGPYEVEGGGGGKGGEVSGGGLSGNNTRKTPSTGGRGGNNPTGNVGEWDNVAKQGQGGQGSQGATTPNGVEAFGGSAGAAGAFGYQAPPEGVVGNNTGGTGGGANVANFTGGAARYFGTGSGANSGGAVLLKIS